MKETTKAMLVLYGVAPTGYPASSAYLFYENGDSEGKNIMLPHHGEENLAALFRSYALRHFHMDGMGFFLDHATPIGTTLLVPGYVKLQPGIRLRDREIYRGLETTTLDNYLTSAGPIRQLRVKSKGQTRFKTFVEETSRLTAEKLTWEPSISGLL